MPQFSPFRGIRYRPDAAAGAVSDLATPPYDVIDEEGRGRLEQLHPANAIRLILPRDQVPGDRYERAARTFREWRASGVLVDDDTEAFYRYTMRYPDEDGARRTTTGVIGALGLDGEGVMPHERTMPKAKSDRLDLIRATRANLEPIWGLSLAAGLSALLDSGTRPLARMTDEDGVDHALDLLDDPDVAAAVSAAVAAAPLLIADGHHRYETSLNYRDERRRAGDGPGGHDRIMMLVVELADEQLAVRPIHRLVSGLPAGFDLRGALARSFDVRPQGAVGAASVADLAHDMDRLGAMGLVDASGAALLVPRPGALDAALGAEPEPLRDVDSTRFEAGVLPDLEAAGARGVEVTFRHDRHAVATLVDKGVCQAGVLLRPVPVATIRAVAEIGERMPPKTTFFYPKPRTGLVFRSLEA